MKKRIALLGAGPGGMAAAFELTNKPEYRDNFEVTIYQLGWRLGGKCASGRGEYSRIEEHGLHLLGGSYENAFRILRQAYDEVGWNWEDHFQGRDDVVMQEQVKGTWRHWPYGFNDKPGEPGDGKNTIPDDITDVINRLVRWMHRHTESLEEFHPLKHFAVPTTSEEPPAPHHFLTAAWDELKLVASKLGNLESRLGFVAEKMESFAEQGWDAVEQAIRSDAERLESDVESHLRALESGDHQTLSDWGNKIRHDYILLMTVAAHVIGITKNLKEIVEHGYDVLDDYEYKEWVRTYDPSPKKVVADGGPVNTLYELVFAYKDGELAQPCFSAGVGVRSLYRLCFDYKGAIWYQMQGGTGDIIFGPMYQVLKARGVKFKFFHRINNLHLDENSERIISIDVAEQVALKPGVDEYNPVEELKGLWTWPNQPLYDQLDLTDAEIAELKAMQEDLNGLESNWSPWRERERPYTLNLGEHYDHVVLAISLAALPAICGEIIEAKPQWQTMLAKMRAVETVCLQIWLNQTLTQMGWDTETLGEHPFIADYAKPLSAAGDYSTLAALESWPEGQNPANITYFCSSWSAGENPPPSDTEFPVRTKARFKQDAIVWLEQYLGHLYPGAVSDGKLDWSLFIDSENRSGVARFDAQYWRTNLNPSDHYVLSAPGSSSARIPADGSGVANLTLAGDWIYNGFNLGCVEASMMSGMLAARAVVTEAGMVYDTPIYMEKDFPWLKP